MLPDWKKFRILGKLFQVFFLRNGLNRDFILGNLVSNFHTFRMKNSVKKFHKLFWTLFPKLSGTLSTLLGS
jgi:hypothetical protein